jgi:ribosomal protein S18 acetylase RimI-like enzyme
MIRKAEKDDASLLATLGACVWIDTYAPEGVDKVVASYILDEFTRAKLTEKILNRHVYIVEIDGKAAGYAVLSSDGDSVEMENLYILPRFQTRGFGTRLVEYISDRHRHIWLSCWAKNERALRFYTSKGFRQTGQTTFELGGQSHLNYILELSTPTSGV